MKPADKIRKTIAENKKELQKTYRVKNIEIFGSYARNEQKKESDIDLLVEFREDADLLDLTGLGLFLEEKLGENIDIIPKKALRKEIRDNVLKEAIPI